MPHHADIARHIQDWLEQVVISLNLCPFASRPYRQQQVRIRVSDCVDEACLLDILTEELALLENTPASALETTLIAVPDSLADFYDYNDFLDLAEARLVELGMDQDYQIASFHPHYQFAGTQPQDCENLTNRAPYPLLHLLRQSSLNAALEHYPDPEQIPQRNIETVCNLPENTLKQLFGYLFTPQKRP